MIAKSNERGEIAIQEGKHSMLCDWASQYALRKPSMPFETPRDWSMKRYQERLKGVLVS